jgi:hypothetical protein
MERETEVKIKILNKESEEIPFASLLQAIVSKINQPEGIENTKGKKAIMLMIETLLAQNDPMLTALGVLGGEKTLNAAGLLLFVAFQIGSLVGSGDFTVVSEDELLTPDPVAE